VLARRVYSPHDLQRRLTLQRWATRLIKRLVRRLGDLMRDDAAFDVDLQHMVGEAVIEGLQINGSAKWLGNYRYAIVNLGGADRDRRPSFPSRQPPSGLRACTARGTCRRTRSCRRLKFRHDGGHGSVTPTVQSMPAAPKRIISPQIWL
jgi:hypothetical protein